MLTSERREKKQGKIRNSEYYGMESIFDTLYAESRNGKTFNHLMAIIESEENIKLAWTASSSYWICSEQKCPAQKEIGQQVYARRSGTDSQESEHRH